MPRKTTPKTKPARSRRGQSITVTDLFCGAGGSSQGAKAAGAEVRLAANHWKLAVEVHARNFPDTDHDCADISQTEPRRYPRTDVLLASPECTTHSIARSNTATPDLFNPDGDPSVERSRATMWDVVRFAEIHRYEACIVENVAEVAKWLPFQAWLSAMEALGYDHHIVNMNSMVAPSSKAAMRAPQSRDRIYVVFWRKGNRRPDLDLRPQSWCTTCGTVVDGVQTWKRGDRARIGKYRQQYFYSCGTCHSEVHPLVAPAASAIDWSLPCPLVGERKRPLAAATRKRIEIGLRQFGAPLIAQAAGHTFERPGYARVWPADGRPMPTQTTDVQHGVVIPMHHLSDEGRSGVPSWQPLHTQTGRAEQGLAVHPFFLKNYGSESEAKYRAHSIATPWGAITGSDSHSLVVPFIAELRGGGSKEAVRSIMESLATVTASGNHHGLCVPGSFFVKNYGGAHQADQMVKPITDPFGSITTVDSTSVVVPFLTSYYGQGGATPTDHPVPTVTTKDRHALVDPAEFVDECGFRMLEPHEIQRAMAFADDYELEGTKRDRVKLLGNAVTPPAMAWITERVMASLA